MSNSETPTGDFIDGLLRGKAPDAIARFPLTFAHDGERWQIVYRYIPAETLARLQAIERKTDDAYAIPMLLASLVSWDRTRSNGQPLPLNFKELKRIPKTTIAALMAAIQDDQRRLGYLQTEAA